LVQGRFEAPSRAEIRAIAARAVDAGGVDGVILGCTEFGLLMRDGDFDVPSFDTTDIHARAGLAFALGDA